MHKLIRFKRKSLKKSLIRTRKTRQKYIAIKRFIGTEAVLDHEWGPDGMITATLSFKAVEYPAS